MCALKLDLDTWELDLPGWVLHVKFGCTELTLLWNDEQCLQRWQKKLFANTLHTNSTYWLTRAITVPWVWTWLSSNLILLTAGCASVGVGAVKSEKAVLTGYIRNFSWHKTYERWRQLNATWIAPWATYCHSQLHSQSYMQSLHL